MNRKQYGVWVGIDSKLSERRLRKLSMMLGKKFNGAMRRKGLKPKQFIFSFIVHRNEWPLKSTLAIKATEKVS